MSHGFSGARATSAFVHLDAHAARVAVAGSAAPYLCRDHAARGERRFVVVLLARALALVLTLVVVGCGADQEEVVGPERARPPELVLAGDGEMWVVDVAAERARHVRVRELSPGGPGSSGGLAW
jgi:hypothetical protein